MKKAIKIKTQYSQKRYGHHHKRTKSFNETYLPYLPMTVLVFLSIFISGYSPKHATLAYATEMSQQTLLNETNAQRKNYGKDSLKLNEQLNSAAQAKANDMVSRNYWSHNTPDGKEPWVFVNGSGYSYLKAGENLAYGFGSSSSTINGWMNSPTHKDNLLDSEFKEVGFGFANSSNYNNSGKETIVVAMYGKPYVLSTSTQSATATAQNSNTQSNTNKSNDILVSKPKRITRVESLWGNIPAWLIAVITFNVGFLMAILLLRHTIRFKKLIKDSKNFVTHHPLIDSTIIGLIILGITLLRVVGHIL